MKHFSKITILFFVFALTLASGCKKLSTDTSLLVLNLHPYFGADSLVFGRSYRMSSGDSISFGRVSYYVSGIQLTTTSGTAVSVGGHQLITALNYMNIILGSVPIGTYKSISFNIGLDQAANHQDPGTYGSGPLAVQSPSMHFANDTIGYIFLVAEGLVDSTNSNASPNKAFSYHIGTDSLLQAVNLPDHSVAPYTAYAAVGTKLLTIDIIADFSQLVKNVNVPLKPVTNTTDNLLLADTLASHIPAMFRYKQ